MTFDIVTTVSPNFADGERLFVPSWHRNSGAAKITINRTNTAQWYENIIRRNENIRNAVLRGGRVLSLDLDCFVLSDLSGGFDGAHPFAVARWPLPNMGVAFFDGRMSFDWEGFFRPLIAGITKRCNDPRIQGTRFQKGRFGDQYHWQDALAARNGDVRKLDMNVWNFCHQPEDWKRELMRHRERVKVIHVKGRGNWEKQPKILAKIKMVRRMFPEKILE